MAKHKLVIVESPAKAKTIAKLLGKGYKVEASNGHVRDLPKSQMGVDIDNNFEPHYITIRGRGEILDKIRKEAKNASSVLLATDPDREGEAISWHLANVLKLDPNAACRVQFHEITSDAIKNAVKSPKPIDRQLVDAQQARRVLDRLVGYKISPLLWAKVRKGLSAGRVQSVATRLIADREEAIDAFVPEEYWTITTAIKAGGVTFNARLYGYGDQKVDIRDGETASEAVRRIENARFTVTKVKRGEKHKHPAPPFTTSHMQQEAARKLSFTTRKTMQIAQMLYEGIELEGVGTVGLISYIRTDSTRLSEEALSAARAYIGEHYAPEYLPESPNVYKGRKDAQDAHEAIRPTNVEWTPARVRDSLTRDQYKLYKLIYERFLASQMTSIVYGTMNINLEGDSVALHFSGMKKTFPGFSILYEESRDDPEEKEVALPDINEGEIAEVLSVTPEQHFTQPPPRYTEASLVRAMEEMGIGRPSTYAPTISTIMTRGYVAKEGKALYPTEMGELVTDMMKEYFSDIVDVQFTAGLEERLDEVEEGGADWRDIVKDFYESIRKNLEVAESAIEKVEVADEVSDVPCQKCGTLMVYKMGRFGRFLACPKFPECRFTMPILKEAAACCPQCGGKLYERTSRKGRRFYGCERYPDCAFVSWDEPVQDKCPQCGGYMVLKRDRNGEKYHQCADAQCKTKVKLETVEDEE